MYTLAALGALRISRARGSRQNVSCRSGLRAVRLAGALMSLPAFSPRRHLPSDYEWPKNPQRPPEEIGVVRLLFEGRAAIPSAPRTTRSFRSRRRSSQHRTVLAVL